MGQTGDGNANNGGEKGRELTEDEKLQIAFEETNLSEKDLKLLFREIYKEPCVETMKLIMGNAVDDDTKADVKEIVFFSARTFERGTPKRTNTAWPERRLPKTRFVTNICSYFLRGYMNKNVLENVEMVCERAT